MYGVIQPVGALVGMGNGDGARYGVAYYVTQFPGQGIGYKTNSTN